LSETAEVGPARRNLLVLTSLLLVIELTGATIKSINAPAVTIDIQRPELIIWILYLTLAYLMFRFWQIARPTHVKYSQISNKFINQLPLIKRISDASLDAVDEEGYHASDNNPSISRGFFTRTLTISGHNKLGRGVNKGPIKLPYAKVFLPELIADLRAIPTHKDFVEYTFPFLYANAVVILKAFFILHKQIIR
jgi:hypothetical protein